MDGLGLLIAVGNFDDPAATMPPGEPGELMVRGPIVMLGYYGDDSATAAAIEEDGWLHTGDLAVSDEFGRWNVGVTALVLDPAQHPER